MRFEEFAAAHGLIIHYVEYGAWRRVPTTDHPRKRNGAYRHLGEVAFVQNHATMSEVSVWHPDADRDIRIDSEAIARRAAEADRARRLAQLAASAKAQAIIKTCRLSTHPYLASKGFPDALGLVTEAGELIIPMRDCETGAVLGAQKIALIENEWEKKMLFGMRAKGASYRIGNARAPELWFVEGYATGLSVDSALKLLRISAAVMVCFSASNLVYAASRIAGRRFVFADNDASLTGERSAWKTGLPYAMAPTTGQDANDLHMAAGVMAVAKKIMEARTK